MQVPGPGLRLVPSLALLAATASVIALTPAAAQAAPAPASPAPPRSAVQAMDELTSFNEQFEKVTEQYNDARILTVKRQAQARVADARARAAQARYATVATDLRRIISGSYRTAPFGQFASMLSSDSPDEFIDRMSTLNIVATRRGAAVLQLGRVRTAAHAAQRQAAQALTSAQRMERELGGRRADLERRAARSRVMFQRLSAQERAAFLAADGHGAGAERASRSTTRPPANVPATGRARTAVQTALAQLGDPYVWAAAGPDAFDCSGLTMYAWAAAGVQLPHSSRMQYSGGRKIGKAELQPGDLIFFYSPISHVGMYIGNGQMVHAPTFNDVVKIASIDGFPWAGAVRPG